MHTGLIKDLIGQLRQFGMNKNVCHFSVGSLCCWNLRDVFCDGFSFQTPHSGISSSSTVCYCKAAVCVSCVCVCYNIPLLVLCAFLCVDTLSVSVGQCRFDLMWCIFVPALSIDLCLVRGFM